MGHRPPVMLKKIAAKRATPGLLILDADSRLLYMNAEAGRILAWSSKGHPASLADFEALIPREVQEWYRRLGQDGPGVAPGVIYRSGQRWYLARRLDLEAKPGQRDGPAGVLLERMSESRLLISRIGRQYRLTPREQELVTYITQGLRDKQAARHMGISFHTVRASLRTIRAKLGVTTRTGIVARFLTPTSFLP